MSRGTLWVGGLLALGCAHAPVARPPSASVTDTSPAFLAAWKGHGTSACLASWDAYRTQLGELRGEEGGDPATGLCQNPPTATAVQGTARALVLEAPRLFEELGRKGVFGAGELSVVVLPSRRPYALRGRQVLLNAAHPAMADETSRQVLVLRALAAHVTLARQHRDLLARRPLLERLHQESLAMLAAASLVPSASAEQLSGCSNVQLKGLEKRTALLATELLAGLDSASEGGEARFFAEGGDDPLVPRCAGPYLALRLKAGFDQTSLERAFQKPPSEFLRLARTLLLELAQSR